MVKSRMRQYQSAMLQDEVFEQMLGKRFKKLQEENVTLRALADKLKRRLDKVEARNAKV